MIYDKSTIIFKKIAIDNETHSQQTDKRESGFLPLLINYLLRSNPHKLAYYAQNTTFLPLLREVSGIFRLI